MKAIAEVVAKAQLIDSGLVKIPALSLTADRAGNLYVIEDAKKLSLRRRPKVKRITLLYQRVRKSLSELIWPL